MSCLLRVGARSVVPEVVQVHKTKLDFGASRKSKASISVDITVLVPLQGIYY
jgi:hypothetical protein